jgi:NAD(P)-dependent dehydrogenase (short-subunit alcohol dehydrogenase family)
MTSAVKAAVIVSTQSLEAEWAKYGIAWAVIFLASDQANFIIRETLYVSGGPKTSSRED